MQHHAMIFSTLLVGRMVGPMVRSGGSLLLEIIQIRPLTCGGTLGTDFGILVARKLPLPENPEAGFGRTVIVIDDGIAMGSTMTAALRCCRLRRPKTLIAASPVASPRTVGRLGAIADHVVAVTVPRGFRAVADAYQHWRDLDDQDVLSILSRFSADTGPASPTPPAT